MRPCAQLAEAVAQGLLPRHPVVGSVELASYDIEIVPGLDAHAAESVALALATAAPEAGRAGELEAGRFDRLLGRSIEVAALAVGIRKESDRTPRQILEHPSASGRLPFEIGPVQTDDPAVAEAVAPDLDMPWIESSQPSRIEDPTFVHHAGIPFIRAAHASRRHEERGVESCIGEDRECEL